MRVKIKDFVIEARLQDLEIEAESEEDALDKLSKMSLQAILSEEPYIDDLEIKDVESEIAEYDFDAKAESIEYDVDDMDLMGTDFETVEDLIGSLPTERAVCVRYCEDESDERDLIRNEIEDEAGYPVKSFDYEVTKRY